MYVCMYVFMFSFYTINNPQLELDLPLSVPEFDWQAFTTTKQTKLTGYSTVHSVRVKAPSAPSNTLAQFS